MDGLRSCLLALGVAGKLVDSRSAAVHRELQDASEAPQLTTRRRSGKVEQAWAAERLIVRVQSVGKHTDVVNAVRRAYLALITYSPRTRGLPLWDQLTQVTSSP
jgi:hypothetical protein